MCIQTLSHPEVWLPFETVPISNSWPLAVTSLSYGMNTHGKYLTHLSKH